MKTRSEIMKKGHEIARTLEGDYRARLSEGLRISYKISKATDPNYYDEIKFDQQVVFSLTLNFGAPRFSERKNDIKRMGGRWNPEQKNWTILGNYIPDYLSEYVTEINF